MRFPVHTPGFPRIGARRELKQALEAYWNGTLQQGELEHVGRSLRRRHWEMQARAGARQVPVDFAWYDQMLEWSCTLGVVPARFAQDPAQPVALDTLFRMARGRAPSGSPTAACEMTKWFDTNYHYIVPELHPGQTFRIARESLFEWVAEARELGLDPRPVIPGPLTWLWLAKGEAWDGPGDAGKLELLENLIPLYREVLRRCEQAGASWVQLDEPILVLDLPASWRRAFLRVYEQLASASGLRILLASYFGSLDDNLFTALELPVDGLHLDLVRGPEQLAQALPRLGRKVLSAGVVDGRNIWRTDLEQARDDLFAAAGLLGERLWLAPSCSLLHVPVDLEQETALDPELKGWLSFAVQKLEELALLSAALAGEPPANGWAAQARAVAGRRVSARVGRDEVQARLRACATLDSGRAHGIEARRARQRARLALPPFPTTTIGSFPQTAEIRALRRDHRRGDLDDASYDSAIRAEIEHCIREQEALGLDVLVHGEAERNDMVEFFGERLDGFAFTQSGWVQSYGSRCVKPPVIFGDVSRPGPITVELARYAQSLTERPVKGMLTGPVTVLQWSFVRDDQSREITCRQIALALRDEVLDLEAAGIAVIQVDEPALREGLPLRRARQEAWLAWAIECFRLTCGGVRDDTQIHTHMCYAEFNDIIGAIAGLDADVITIETSRSNMELLGAFERFDWPGEIGPGVYDIHSPNVPDQAWMVRLLRLAARRIPAERLWVNPDCGLKTRGWPETRAALAAMVAAARTLRAGAATRSPTAEPVEASSR